MMYSLRRYLMAAVDLILPRGCLACGKRLTLEERHICIECLSDMPLTRYWERNHNPMSDRFNETIQEHYAHAAALFFYHSEAGYRHIPYQIKYHGNLTAGRYFGSMLGRRLTGKTAEKRMIPAGDGQVAEDRLWADVDMVIPVPLHWTRRWKRGYNQAEVIAEAIAEAMDVPMRNDILIRRRRTKSQVTLDIEDKARNVSGAFAVSDEAKAEMNRTGGKAGRRHEDPDLKTVRHILLVDDVFTTGSTMTACFSALREIFPSSVRISAVTLGYLER